MEFILSYKHIKQILKSMHRRSDATIWIQTCFSPTEEMQRFQTCCSFGAIFNICYKDNLFIDIIVVVSLFLRPVPPLAQTKFSTDSAALVPK